MTTIRNESFVHPANGATYTMEPSGRCWYNRLEISQRAYMLAKRHAEEIARERGGDGGGHRPV